MLMPEALTISTFLPTLLTLPPCFPGQLSWRLADLELHNSV